MEPTDVIGKAQDTLDTTVNQMSLDLFLSDDDSPDTTRTLRVYDLAPKYVYDNPVVLLADANTSSVERELTIKNTIYKTVITAGNIRDDDGLEYLAFPSAREELVEIALRKLAVSGGEPLQQRMVG